MVRKTLKDIFAKLRLVYDEVRLNVDTAKQEIEDNATRQLPAPMVDMSKVAVVKQPERSFPSEL